MLHRNDKLTRGAPPQLRRGGAICF